MSLPINDELVSIQDYIRYAYSRFNDSDIFFGHGTDNAWDEAVHLVLHSLHLSWDFDNALWSSRLIQSERQLILDRIHERIENHTPLAYLLGEAWFMQMPFVVNPHVLIPRSPIAEMIENAFRPWVTTPPVKILDMCTGSGCIGIATALRFEDAVVDLVDISSEALEVAQENIVRYDLTGRVHAIQSNLFSEVTEKYDLILANPPYVDQHDFESMPAEFHTEPALGLVAGKDGLDIAHIILKQAAEYLNDEGYLILEVGNSWVALEAYYNQVPFTWVEFENGGHGVLIMSKSELEMYFQ